MRFKEYLNEAALSTVPKTNPIELEAAMEWAKEHSPSVMKRVRDGKVSLLRGVEGSKGMYQLGDTSTFKRVSKNTHNYYTKFIASSPKWSKYPSRESAYICATNDRIAAGYGDLFYVIPADNAKIGKCDSHDIWKSFPILEKSIGLPGLNSLNLLLISLMKAIDGEVTPDTDSEAIRKSLRGMTMKKLYDLVENPTSKINHQNRQSVESAVETMMKKKIGNFEELLEYCLDPEVNNFKTYIASDADVPPKPGVEAWVEGKALFIREDQLKDFLEKYFS